MAYRSPANQWGYGPRRYGTPASRGPRAPVPNPAASTWGASNLQGLTDAWLGQGNAPTAEMAQGGYAAPTPTFDPYGDVGYAAGASAIENVNQHAGAEHDYQIHRGGQNYGYDASGNLITSGADLNPYAQAAVLKKNYDNTVRGTDTSYAAQGQLYAGSRLNAQNTNDWNYGTASDQLKRSAADFYHSNDTSLQGTKDQGLMQLAQLLGPAFQNFLLGQKGT